MTNRIDRPATQRRSARGLGPTGASIWLPRGNTWLLVVALIALIAAIPGGRAGLAIAAVVGLLMLVLPGRRYILAAGSLIVVGTISLVVPDLPLAVRAVVAVAVWYLAARAFRVAGRSAARRR